MLTNDLFILGAGGFVGSTLAREAVQAGLLLRRVLRLPTG